MCSMHTFWLLLLLPLQPPCTYVQMLPIRSADTKNSTVAHFEAKTIIIIRRDRRLQALRGWETATDITVLRVALARRRWRWWKSAGNGLAVTTTIRRCSSWSPARTSTSLVIFVLLFIYFFSRFYFFRSSNRPSAVRLKSDFRALV